MQTCPICKTGLETLELGFFEENGEKYERILWRCPLQPTKVKFIYSINEICSFAEMLFSDECFALGSVLDKKDNGTNAKRC